mgnify:CR=1 FL=1
MKIVIIESRNNIAIWDRVFVNGLDGFIEPHYFIFNKFYSSNYGKNHYLKFGVSSEHPVEVPVQYDRQRNFFNSKSTDHYGHYYSEIKSLILKIEPKLIFGEAASFQDYLTIKICRELGITYLNPMTSRYPKNRFAFYLEDTLIPFLGSMDESSDSELEVELNNIVCRKSTPDYMQKKNYKLNYGKRANDLWVKFKSYLNNDPNTPSGHSFINRKLRLRGLKKKWHQQSTTFFGNDNKGMKVLYAMQMQPESNIDVYGHPYNNQSKLIEKIYNSLGESDILVIKPNPKPFMELSESIIDIAKKNNRVVLVPFDYPMKEVFDKVDMIISVTGTVAIEAILSNKPIAVLKKTYFNDVANCTYLRAHEEISDFIEKIRKGGYNPISWDKRKKHLDYLTKVSYKGRISSVNLNQNEVLTIQKSFVLFFDQFLNR